MPVQTRSQRKIQYQSDNIQITLDDNNTRLVKFYTPEKKQDEKLTCPPTPRAPRATKKAFPSFGTAVRRLDFTKEVKVEMYPQNYKNFMIANKFQKKKIDEFLAMIDDFAEKKDIKKASDNQSAKFNAGQLVRLTDDEVIDMAKSLNSNTTFWEIYRENSINESELNSTIYHWANLLSCLILIYLTRAVQEANSIPIEKSRSIITDKIVPNLISFKEVFVHEKFPRFSNTRRFLGVMMQKMLSFANSGFVLAPLVIRKYYPHMVTKECYPLVIKDPINIYADSLKYARESTHTEIMRLFTECQSIYNFV
jgi:hypothetical protein